MRKDIFEEDDVYVEHAHSKPSPVKESIATLSAWLCPFVYAVVGIMFCFDPANMEWAAAQFINVELYSLAPILQILLTLAWILAVIIFIGVPAVITCIGIGFVAMKDPWHTFR